MKYLPLAVLALLFTTLVAARGNAPEVLAEINFARTQPQEYARVVEAYADRYPGKDGAKLVREAISFLRRARPLPPLVWSEGISLAALNHAQEVGARGGHGHRGLSGSTPWRRMSRYGQYAGYAGENIDYGHDDARGIVVSLIVDRGVPDRAHRTNLFSRNFRVAGVAIAPHARCGTMCVMDFATAFTEAGGQPRIASRMGFRSDYMGNSFF